MIILFAFTALAAVSTAAAAKTYLGYAWNETAPEIHGTALQGRNGYFYLGGQSYPECGSEPCSVQNKTIITGPLNSKYSNNNDGFFMYIRDSQPQMIATLSNADMVYTLPRTDLGDLPSYDTFNLNGGTRNTPFSVDFDDFSNQTVLRFNGNDWVSCSTHAQYGYYGYQPYSVKALSYGSIAYKENLPCTPFKLRLVETFVEEAPLYYKYPCHRLGRAEKPPPFACLDFGYKGCTWEYVQYVECTKEESDSWTTKVVPYIIGGELFGEGGICQCRSLDPYGTEPGDGVAS